MRLSRILLIVGGLGVLLSGVGLFFDHLYPPQLHFVEPPPQAHVTIRSAPDRIVIPDLSIDLPVDSGGIVNGEWSVSPTNANHLATSAHPGDSDNIVMYGHDSREVLGRLKRATVGQAITLYDKSGGEHFYEISEIFTTNPTDVSVIASTDTETLTVYTCTGLFNEQRLIVRALPISS